MNFRCLQETSHSGVGVNKNSKGFIIEKSTDTSLSMIVAFSKIRVYGCFASQETISSEQIKYFYSEIYKAKSTLFRDECTPILVCDNAKYHKSESIKNFIDGSNARIFTLVPYSPFLNPAEQMIGYIKSKIKKELLRGKVLCLNLIKGIIEAITERELKGFVKASKIETIQKINTLIRL